MGGQRFKVDGVVFEAEWLKITCEIKIALKIRLERNGASSALRPP